jgi:AcrR family transcriptional regulator
MTATNKQISLAMPYTNQQVHQLVDEGSYLVDYLVTHFYAVSMARPKSKDKRNAIMEATTRVIVSQGLSAPTALIAKEAGISNGSLFTYFETKADLFNQLYLELKTEMTAAAMKDPPENGDLREQVFHAWSNWIDWAVSNPHKRLALRQLADRTDWSLG